MSSLIEYEPLQSYFNKIIATDDVETQGKLIGKNACTAWVSFDGTTTPATIEDSFNVSDVVRTAIGRYVLYFEEAMDNADYVKSGMAHHNATVNADGIVLKHRDTVADTTTSAIIQTAVSASYQEAKKVTVVFYGGKA